MNPKFEPVRVFSVVVAALSAFLGIAGLTDRVPEDVVFWCSVALAVLTAAGGAWVRSATTPLAEPQAKDGRRLVPSPPANVPPGTPARSLDATRPDDASDVGIPPDTMIRRHGPA